MKKVFALTEDDRGRLLTAILRPRQQRSAFERIKGNVLTCLTLKFEITLPCGEFVGPGFDGINITSGIRRREATKPAIIIVQGHRRPLPVTILLMPPDQLRDDDVVSAPEYVGPDIHNVSSKAFDGKASGFHAGVNILDMKCAGGCAFFACTQRHDLLHRYGHAALTCWME